MTAPQDSSNKHMPGMISRASCWLRTPCRSEIPETCTLEVYYTTHLIFYGIFEKSQWPQYRNQYGKALLVRIPTIRTPNYRNSHMYIYSIRSRNCDLEEVSGCLSRSFRWDHVILAWSLSAGISENWLHPQNITICKLFCA